MHCIVKSPVLIIYCREDLLYNKSFWLSEIMVLLTPSFFLFPVMELRNHGVHRVPSLYFNWFSYCSCICVFQQCWWQWCWSSNLIQSDAFCLQLSLGSCCIPTLFSGEGFLLSFWINIGVMYGSFSMGN